METFRYKSYSCNFIIFCYIFYLEKIYCYSEHIWIKMLLKFIFYVFLDPSDRVLHNYYLSKNSKLNENLSRTEKIHFFNWQFFFSILVSFVGAWRPKQLRLSKEDILLVFTFESRLQLMTELTKRLEYLFKVTLTNLQFII